MRVVCFLVAFASVGCGGESVDSEQGPVTVDLFGERTGELVPEVERYKERKGRLVWDGAARIQYGPTKSVSGLGLSRLFPGWRFYSLGWSFVQVKHDVPVHIPMGFSAVLAFEPSGEVIELMSYGDRREFGTLLARAAVVVRDDDDAAVVDRAYGEIFGAGGGWNKRRKTGGWDLGIRETKGYREWFYLRVDPAGKVVGGERKIAQLSVAPATPR